MSAREWVVYLASGEIHNVEAPNLRAALRKFSDKKVVAGIAAACVPAPTDDARPFLAVLLKNPRYVEPELPE